MTQIVNRVNFLENATTTTDISQILYNIQNSESMAMEIKGSETFTLKVEASNDGDTWQQLSVIDLDFGITKDITKLGMYQVPIGGITQIRCGIKDITGAITVTGKTY